MLPVTRQLAEYLSATTSTDTAPAHDEARRAVLDWLGSALAGSFEQPAQIVRHVASRLGRAEEATVFGGGRASAVVAALANGVASHILELDDIHKGSTIHGGAPIISAALAVAEREHRSGIDLLSAVVVGYEAAFHIGEAVNPSHYRYWHPTGTVATFGAAVAAGWLLRLDADRLVHALGTAGTQAAGLWEFNADGAMSKHLHPGKAAMNGILAADLAAAGFTGASRILEGPRGFLAAMSEASDADRMVAGIGTGWKITENGYKLHACCAHTHTAIDVALALRSGRRWTALDVRDFIREIDVETYGPGYAIVSAMNPCSSYQGKFSLAYCVAAALTDGVVGLDQFSPARFGLEGVVDPAIAALLPRMRVRVTDDLTGKYPAAWPSRLTVSLTTGEVVKGASDYPHGHPENPVSTEALAAKFMALVAPRLGQPRAAAAARAVRDLDGCCDVAHLFSGGPASAAPDANP